MKSLRILSLLFVASLPLLAQGEPHVSRCPQCGCCQLKKCCKLVPDVKKVTKTVYDYECEDFCVPGPSKLCGVKCVPDCNALCGIRHEKIWQPCCGEVRTRKKLVKKVITEEKPGFKCVVVVTCCGCGGCCGEMEPCGEAEATALLEKQADENHALAQK